jgi:hypothetical protein
MLIGLALLLALLVGWPYTGVVPAGLHDVRRRASLVWMAWLAAVAAVILVMADDDAIHLAAIVCAAAGGRLVGESVGLALSAAERRTPANWNGRSVAANQATGDGDRRLGGFETVPSARRSSRQLLR